MSPDDLKLYALSYKADQPMVRMVALETITLEGCYLYENDGDLSLQRASDSTGTVVILRGHMFACEPDLAAELHREGSAVIEDEPPAQTIQQPKITGYRQLSQAEADLMNEIKAEGERLGALVAKLRGNPDLDQRWVSIGQTDLQQGLMSLTRAVAQPTTF